MESLERPLATEEEIDAALRCAFALRTGARLCPDSVARKLKGAVEELLRACEDTARRELLAEVLRAVPRIRSKVPARVADRPDEDDSVADRPDEDDNEEDVLLSIWSSFVTGADRQPPDAADGRGSVAETPSTSAAERIVPSRSPLRGGRAMVGKMEYERRCRVLSAVASKMQYESAPEAVSSASARRSPPLAARRRFGRGLWLPGFNVRGLIGRGTGTSIGPQAQMLIANAHQRVAAVPKPDRQTIKRLFPHVGKRAKNFAANVVSGLLRIPAKTILNTVTHVKRGRLGRRPVISRAAAAAPAETGAPAETVTPQASLASAAAGSLQVPAAVASPAVGYPSGFLNLLRACAFISSRGWPKDALPHLVHVIVEAKGDVHSSYHGPDFITVFDKAVHDIVVGDLSHLLSQPLGGTGRPPDVELIADGVSIGKFYSRQRDTIFLVGLQFSIPTEPYTASVCIGAENECCDAGGKALLEKLRAAFGCLGVPPGTPAGDPFAYWADQRIATSCGDGQLAAGGPESRHASSKVFPGLKMKYKGGLVIGNRRRISFSGPHPLEFNFSKWKV